MKAVIIGASTGGPQTIREVLKGLPEDLRAIVLIVQHISGKISPLLAKSFQTDYLTTTL